jgi:hypothetical protein
MMVSFRERLEVRSHSRSSEVPEIYRTGGPCDAETRSGDQAAILSANAKSGGLFQGVEPAPGIPGMYVSR